MANLVRFINEERGPPPGGGEWNDLLTEEGVEMMRREIVEYCQHCR